MKKAMAVLMMMGIVLGMGGVASASPLTGGVPDPTWETNAMLLWLKADAGFAPALWQDQSTYGNDAAQGTLPYQPSLDVGGLNGADTVMFDGLDRHMIIATPPANYQTAFFVYKDTSTQSWVTPLGTIYNGGGGAGGAYHGQINDSGIFSATYTDPKTRGGENYRNGLDVGDGVSTPRPDVYVIDAHVATGLLPQGARTIGADDGFGTGREINGGIAEILLYNRPLLWHETNDIANYLEGKYGITWDDISEPPPAPVSYTSAASGNWSLEGTWTPAGGPPVAQDTATIQSGHQVGYDPGAAGSVDQVTITGGGSKLTLGQGLAVSGIAIAKTGGTLDLNGQTMDTTTLHIDSGTLARTGGGTLLAANLTLQWGVTMNLGVDDVIANFASTWSTVSLTTAATGNITNSVSVGAGPPTTTEHLYLGADLVLTGNITLNRPFNDGGYLHTGGHNVTANTLTIYMSTPIMDRDMGGLFTLNNYVGTRLAVFSGRAGDIINQGIYLNQAYNDGSFLHVDQQDGDVAGLTLGSAANPGAVLQFNHAGSKMTLNFDSAPATEFDWAFRWYGDHANQLQGWYIDGYVVVNSDLAFDLMTNIVYRDPLTGGDGYTYVGFESPIPEPAGIGLIGLALIALKKKRC